MSLDTPSFEQMNRQSRDNQFRFIFRVLTDHWMLIAAGALIGAFAFGGLAWFLRETATELYTTYGEVVITPSPWDKEFLKDVGAMSMAVTPKLLVDRINKRTLAENVASARLQRELARGGMLGRISSKEEFSELSADIESKLTLTALDETNRVRIEVKNGVSRQEAQDIAEFATRAFLAQTRETSLKEGEETHRFILNKLEELQHQLFAAETAEWDYKRKMGFRMFGKVDEDMANTYKELNTLKATKEELDAKIKELDSELAANSQTLPQSLEHVSDAVVDQLFSELNMLLQEKLSLSVEFTSAYPELQSIEEQITEKQQAIISALEQLDTGVAGGSSIWKRRQEIYREQMNLRTQLTGTEVRIASLERLLEDLVPQIPELANKNLEYERLVQETQSIREQFNKLRDREWKVRSAISQGAAQVERFDPVHKAMIMPLSGSTQFWVNFLIGAIAGFILALCYALMYEYNDTSIRNIEDVSEYIGLEVIGTIPRMRFGKPRGRKRRRATYVTTVEEERVDACIVTQHDPKSPISEAYRTLRTNYQFATIKQNPRTLMLTSAVPGEGKTTTAVNAAVTMADFGMRVLIVDTDLRRPNIHRVLRMERGLGLADVLKGEMDIDSVVRPTRIRNLWIVSSGRVPSNPSELIGSERMTEVMKHLGEEFDIVICDAPSVLVVTDPVLLATHVDTCIMVVSTNNARRETVIRANKLLQSAKINVVGVLLNGLETTRRHYYYYYYYYDDTKSERRKWYHFG